MIMRLNFFGGIDGENGRGVGVPQGVCRARDAVVVPGLFLVRIEPCKEDQSG